LYKLCFRYLVIKLYVLCGRP